MEVQDLPCKCDLFDKKSTSVEEETFITKLNKHIKDIIKKEGYLTYDIEQKNLSTDGGSYLGILCEVDIKGQTKDGEKETNIFVKQVLPDDNHQIISVSDAYFRESYYYKELTKVFEDLQNEADVPIKERFNTAKSYHADMEFIMLENLSKKGFGTLHRMDVLPIKYAELCMEQLAKLHGLSFVLQKKRPEYFDKKIKTLNRPYIFGDDWNVFIKKQSELCTRNLNDEYKKKVENFVPIFCEKFSHYIGDTDSPGCTIVHSDYRANNILSKTIDGHFAKVVPVDYQLFYYGCPLYDIFFFIFTGTDRNFRRDHLNNLKDLYYRSMEEFLKFFDLNLHDMYSREEFEKQFKERLDWGLMVAIFLTPFLFTVEGHAPDTAKEKLSDIDYVLDSKFDDRIKGVLDDYIEWGIL